MSLPLEAAQGRLVLVVDDERAVRDLIATILDRAGYRVLTAPSAAEAIGLVEREPVEVVLTDVNMPGSISGLELIDELHARKPSLPIIPVTGSADEANLQEALDRGAAGFITIFMSGYADEAVSRNGSLDADAAFLEKPFSASGLAMKIREVLDSPAAIALR